jgi:hypothetical protein
VSYTHIAYLKEEHKRPSKAEVRQTFAKLGDNDVARYSRQNRRAALCVWGIGSIHHAVP